MHQVSSFRINAPMEMETAFLLKMAHGPDYWVEQLRFQLEKLLLPWFNAVHTTEEAYQQVDHWYARLGDGDPEKARQMPEEMHYWYLLQLGRYAEAKAIVESRLFAESGKECGDMLKWQQRRLLLEGSQNKLANYVAEQEAAALRRFKWKAHNNVVG